MKKRLVALGLIVLAAFSFAGCARNGKVQITEEVINADPWVEYKNITEAEEVVGFEMSYPENFAGHTKGDISIYVVESLNEIEVRYTEDFTDYIRKAKDNGDVSGDYEAYPFEAEVEIDGHEVTVKGESKDTLSLAIWRDGDFAYCVRAEAGIPSEEMRAAVEAVK